MKQHNPDYAGKRATIESCQNGFIVSYSEYLRTGTRVFQRYEDASYAVACFLGLTTVGEKLIVKGTKDEENGRHRGSARAL